MVARKEKQFLIFDVDGKIAKYDLSTGKAYGFSGREVKNISSQLKGITITSLINSFPDENYKAFLKFLNENFVNNLQPSSYARSSYRKVGTRVQNVGTFLSKINNYRFFEQYFSAGLRKIDKNFNAQINELPKGFISWLRNNPEEELNYLTVKMYEKFNNVYGEIERLEQEENFECLDKHSLKAMMLPACNINNCRYYFSADYKNIPLSEVQIEVIPSARWNSNKYNNAYDTLINTYHYNKKSLLHYIDNLMYFEGFSSIATIVEELVDYNRMLTQISNYKYEKYPKNFLTTHQIVCRNYNRLCQECPVEDFKERVRTDFETTIDDYIFIYPKTPQDIKDEAVMQNNCVASYIDKVMNAQCHIMFMRKKDNPTQSVVTLEIKDGLVVQQKGPFNRDTTEEENQVIQQFNKFINKKFSQALKNNSKEFPMPYTEKLVKKKKVG